MRDACGVLLNRRDIECVRCGCEGGVVECFGGSVDASVCAGVYQAYEGGLLNRIHREFYAGRTGLQNLAQLALVLHL